jgi:hypothetical protein
VYGDIVKDPCLSGKEKPILFGTDIELHCEVERLFHSSQKNSWEREKDKEQKEDTRVDILDILLTMEEEQEADHTIQMEDVIAVTSAPTANAVIIAVDPALAIVILARVSLIVFKELFTVLRKLLL